MNCRLFSQHENYTTESQIVKLIFRIKINSRFVHDLCITDKLI